MNDGKRVIQAREVNAFKPIKTVQIDNIERAGWISIEEQFNQYLDNGRKYNEYMKILHPDKSLPDGTDILEGKEEMLAELDNASKDRMDLEDYREYLALKTKSLQEELTNIQNEEARIKAESEAKDKKETDKEDRLLKALGSKRKKKVE